jgi:hypothetical protein
VTLGKFVPASTGEYTVSVTPSDSTITLIAGPKAIKIAPFAAATMTAAPTTVPISVPLVQAHTKISRGNTIIIPDDLVGAATPSSSPTIRSFRCSRPTSSAASTGRPESSPAR